MFRFLGYLKAMFHFERQQIENLRSRMKNTSMKGFEKRICGLFEDLYLWFRLKRDRKPQKGIFILFLAYLTSPIIRLQLSTAI